MRPAWIRRSLAAAAALAAIAVAAGLWWGLTPLGPTASAVRALEDDRAVNVEKTGAGYEFSPASGPRPAAALVFYPGGHVDVRSYAPLCRKIAAEGRLVVLVPMPFSLAVLAPNRASAAIAAHPEIRSWAVGGHSLGGAMAASFAASHAGQLDAVALYAAYAAGSTDLSGTGLRVLDVYGSRDGILNRENHEAGRSKLPSDTTEIVIPGGNHGQFGDYGHQPGDRPATISRSRQQRIAADATERLLQTIAP